MTSKQARSNYKLPHSGNQSPLRPTKFQRREPSDWGTCGMNEKNCLAWVEIVTRRTDRTDIFTYRVQRLYTARDYCDE